MSVMPKGETTPFFATLFSIIRDHKTCILTSENRFDVTQVNRGRMVKITSIFLTFEGITQSTMCLVTKWIHSGTTKYQKMVESRLNI